MIGNFSYDYALSSDAMYNMYTLCDLYSIRHETL
jgi:hypothetical protein